MSTTAESSSLHRQIVNAAAYSGESELHGHDPTYKAFKDMMEYRKKIARKYLDEDNEKLKSHCLEIFQYCNEKIKQILSL